MQNPLPATPAQGCPSSPPVSGPTASTRPSGWGSTAKETQEWHWKTDFTLTHLSGQWIVRDATSFPIASPHVSILEKTWQVLTHAHIYKRGKRGWNSLNFPWGHQCLSWSCGVSITCEAAGTSHTLQATIFLHGWIWKFPAYMEFSATLLEWRERSVESSRLDFKEAEGVWCLGLVSNMRISCVCSKFSREQGVYSNSHCLTRLKVGH